VLGTGLGTQNLSKSTQRFTKNYDPQIHQQVIRKDLQQTRSRNKVQLLTTILTASHAFHQTLVEQEKEPGF
jgi:hypothetical protein